MTVFISPDDASLPTLGFDGTSSEMHIFESTMTEEPVEDGSVFNDHIVASAQAFSCEVVMTLTPKGTTFEGEGTASPLVLSFPIEPLPHGLFRFPDGKPKPASLTTAQYPGMPDRIVRQLDLLNALRTGAKPLTVYTDRGVYNSMLLLRVSETNESKWTGKIKLDFKELSVATSEQVAAPKPKEPRGTPGANKGAQEGLLNDIAKGAKDFFGELAGGKNNESWLYVAFRG